MEKTKKPRLRIAPFLPFPAIYYQLLVDLYLSYMHTQLKYWTLQSRVKHMAQHKTTLYKMLFNMHNVHTSLEWKINAPKICVSSTARIKYCSYAAGSILIILTTNWGQKTKCIS